MPSAGRNAGQARQVASGQARQVASGQARQVASGQARQVASGQARQVASGQARQVASGQARQVASPVRASMVPIGYAGTTAQEGAPCLMSKSQSGRTSSSRR